MDITRYLTYLFFVMINYKFWKIFAFKSWKYFKEFMHFFNDGANLRYYLIVKVQRNFIQKEILAYFLESNVLRVGLHSILTNMWIYFFTLVLSLLSLSNFLEITVFSSFCLLGIDCLKKSCFRRRRDFDHIWKNVLQCRERVCVNVVFVCVAMKMFPVYLNCNWK